MKKFLLAFVALVFLGMNAFAQAGTLDLTFDTDGILLVNPTNVFDNAQDVLVLQDNKILLCGTTGTGSNFDMTVIKLNENGTYDNSFGTAGIFTPSNPLGPDYSYDMDLLPNGNIIIVGALSLSDFDTQFAAWVVKPDGTLDPSFSEDGIYEFNNDAGEEYLKSVVIQQNDIFLVGVQSIPGFSYNKIAVQKLDLAGNLDTSFGVNGTANFSTSNTNQFRITEGAYINEGAIVVCGDLYDEASFMSKPILVLLNLNGAPVASFGTNGMWQDTGEGTYYDVEYSNSKIIAAGTNGNSTTVRRHNLDGSFDASFGTNGIFNNGVGGNSIYFDIILGADNKWYACGTTSSGFGVRDFLTSRINLNGGLDLTWAGTGNVVTSLGPYFDDAYGIGLQTDGKVVCGGLTSQPDGNDMGVVRYQGDNGIIYVSGCMSANACNFDPAANVDNGTCYFIGDPCDDGLATTENDAYNSNCICEGVSSVEESNAFGLAIFPNPSQNEITLTSNVVGNGTISIVDMTGRVVLQNKMVFTASQRLNIQGLTNGIYSLIVTVDQKQSVVSFVKL
ncbi:MAG: hypothetical protein RL664_1603 [Bacteroidota bacterium]|jgi:uncharacterized delta-60 repeat protein